jgi:hypothetical protein
MIIPADPTAIIDDNGDAQSALAQPDPPTTQETSDGNKITISALDFGGVNTAGSNALRYPSALPITDSSDYVSFEFFKYKPPFKENSDDYNSPLAMLGDAQGKPILLYMPEDIQSEYGANWGGAGFGLLSKSLMTSAGNAIDGKFNVGEAFSSGVNAAIKAGKRKALDTLISKANQALGTSITSNQALGGTAGKIINPNVEMMYESPEMRGFSLNFKMFASTDGESKEIREICNTFKKNMLPRYGSAFIEIPNIVRVTFMTGSSPNSYVSQFKPCAITNVSINYTPDGSWSAYQEGAPVATQLTIQFKELKMVFAEDITEGGQSY